MSNENINLSPIGSGIIRQSARPISIHVGENGEYWLCDKDVASGSDYADAGCLGHSSVPMAEGG